MLVVSDSLQSLSQDAAFFSLNRWELAVPKTLL